MIFCNFYQVDLTGSGLFKSDWCRNRLLTYKKCKKNHLECKIDPSRWLTSARGEVVLGLKGKDREGQGDGGGDAHGNQDGVHVVVARDGPAHEAHAHFKGGGGNFNPSIPKRYYYFCASV